jgi:GNAT superfamily N-acetyltransferase
MRACLEQLERWGVTTQLADGALPLPGVYGVPEEWPHIRSMYVSHGFVHEGHVEVVYMANVRDIPRSEPPIAGMRIRRSVGINGTRLTAMLGDDELGYVEVDSREEPGRQPLHGGWADIGNQHVVEAYRRKRVGTYLIGQAADWLDLARLDRVLDYAWPEQHAYDAFLRAVGFQSLTRTAGGGARRARRFR